MSDIKKTYQARLQVIATLHPQVGCTLSDNNTHSFSRWSTGQLCFQCDLCGYEPPVGTVVWMLAWDMQNGVWVRVK